MEKKIVPGVIFELEFVQRSASNPNEMQHVAWLHADVLDWHFCIQNPKTKNVLLREHVTYSLLIIDTDRKKQYKIGKVYKFSGRLIYLSTKDLFVVPKNVNEIIDNLNFEQKRAYAFEKAAADLFWQIRNGVDKWLAYSNAYRKLVNSNFCYE